MLERADWTRDLHFQTETTIDTLDYSGSALNAGSKVVIAAVGPPRFELATEIPSDLRLPDGFSNPRVVLPGVLAVEGPKLRESAIRNRYNQQSVHSALPLPPDRHRRRQPIRRRVAPQLPLGHVHAHQPGRRHPRHRALHRKQTLGLPRPAGDRRPPQTPPRPAARRRPRSLAPRRRPRRPRRPAARHHLAACGLATAVVMPSPPGRRHIVRSSSRRQPREHATRSYALPPNVVNFLHASLVNPRRHPIPDHATAC